MCAVRSFGGEGVREPDLRPMRGSIAPKSSRRHSKLGQQKLGRETDHSRGQFTAMRNVGRLTIPLSDPTALAPVDIFRVSKVPRSSQKESSGFVGATLEQHKDGSELISATEATTWTESAAA
jgi:hypothetical protein